VGNIKSGKKHGKPHEQIESVESEDRCARDHECVEENIKTEVEKYLKSHDTVSCLTNSPFGKMPVDTFIQFLIELSTLVAGKFQLFHIVDFIETEAKLPQADKPLKRLSSKACVVTSTLSNWAINHDGLYLDLRISLKASCLFADFANTRLRLLQLLPGNFSAQRFVRSIHLTHYRVLYLWYRMRLVLLVFVSLLFSFSLFAQKEKANWYFGQGAGLKFDYSQLGNPPTAANGNTNTIMASATASDPITGDLLFYTDGRLIYNANHQVMQGSYLTNEETDDIQIVPVPGKNSHYFILATYSSKPRVLLGCVIDMTKDNGLGAVVVPLRVMMPEVRYKFAIVPVCDGFWLITSIFGGQTQLAATLVTSDSISAGKTVISTIGMSIEGQNPYAYANMTVAPKGDRLAVAHGNFWQRNGYVEVFDFNKETGEFSNKLTFDPPNLSLVEGPYISNFSPDGNSLYYSCYCGGGNPLYVLTRPLGNPKRTLITDKRGFIHDMELGPDNTLYILRGNYGRGDSTIDAIRYADVAATPIIIEDYVKLAARARYFPNFVNYAKNSITLNYKTACNKTEATFTWTANTFPNSIQIIYGDGAQSDWAPPATSYTHTYSNSGRYSATIKALFCSSRDTVGLTQEVMIENHIRADLGNDTTICPGTTIELRNKVITYTTYEWSTGKKGPYIEVNKPGTYWIKAGSGLCVAYDTITVKMWPEIWVALGKEYFICEEQSKLAQLDAGKGFVDYKWYPTGDTTQWIITRKTGEHYVIVKDFRGCEGQAGTEVKAHCPPRLYFPNVFSPGTDGLNDIFRPVAENITDYQVIIYNRWGEKVYEGTEVSGGWNGKFKDQNAPEGMYLYTAQYSGYQAASAVKEKYFVKGVVMLVR
jgi:gliding motility-associated-like protein